MHVWLRCGIAAFVAAALQTTVAARPRATISKPDADHVFHQAVTQWIAGNASDASRYLEEYIRQPRSLATRPGRRENARLTNLRAWIEYERAVADPGASVQHSDLRLAQTLAATAMYESPLDLEYWRDYVRIASEQNGSAFDDLLAHNGNYRYEDVRINGEPLQVPGDAGERATLQALRALQADSAGAAQDILEKAIQESPRSCIARVALADIQLSLNRVASATEVLDSLRTECMPGPSVVRMRALIDTLAVTASDRNKEMSAWKQVEPSSWKRLELARQWKRGEAARTQTMIELRAHRYEVQAAVMRNPRDLEAWRLLFAIVVTNGEQRKYEEILRAVRRTQYVENVAAVRIAAAYPLLYTGKFERARDLLASVIPAEGYQAEVLATLAVIDAALYDPDGKGRDRLATLAGLAPETSALLDARRISVCFDNRDECNLAAIFRSNELPDVLRWLDRGCSRRPDANYNLKTAMRTSQIEIRRDFEAMLRESEGRMYASLRAESAQRENIERILRGEIATLKSENMVAAHQRAELHNRLLRVEGRARSLEKQAAQAAADLNAMQNSIRTVHTEVTSVHTDISRLLTQVAFNEDMLTEFQDRFEHRFAVMDADIQRAISVIVARFNSLPPPVEFLGPGAKVAATELQKAISVLQHFGTSTPRQVWEALRIILDRCVNIVYSPVNGLEIDILGTINLIMEMVLGAAPLPDPAA